jgi:hypothetical protein
MKNIIVCLSLIFAILVLPSLALDKISRLNIGNYRESVQVYQNAAENSCDEGYELYQQGKLDTALITFIV